MSSRADLIELLRSELTQVVRRTAVPRVHERIIGRAGVNIDRVEAIALSRIADQGAMRLSELARQLVVACSTAGRHAAHLDDQGLCRRSIDPVDGRAVIVEATAAGHDLIAQLRAGHRALLEEVLRSWTDEDLATLSGLLGRLSSDLDGLADPRRDDPTSSPVTPAGTSPEPA